MPPPLALTLGEPAGIGPDITFAAWRRRAELELAPFYLLADPEFIARRAERIERPARVRMRSRKPWVFARRRLFGWKVRLLTSGSVFVAA